MARLSVLSGGGGGMSSSGGGGGGGASVGGGGGGGVLEGGGGGGGSVVGCGGGGRNRNDIVVFAGSAVGWLNVGCPAAARVLRGAVGGEGAAGSFRPESPAPLTWVAIWA